MVSPVDEHHKSKSSAMGERVTRDGWIANEIEMLDNEGSRLQ
jgi:hypothetical protein